MDKIPAPQSHPLRCLDAIKELAHSARIQLMEDFKNNTLDVDEICEEFEQIEEWASASHSASSDKVLEKLVICPKHMVTYDGCSGCSHGKPHVQEEICYNGQSCELGVFTCVPYKPKARTKEH
jgi:hypothetical protein